MRLRVGHTYRFTHKRKGVFVARFDGYQPGDPADPQLVRVTIATAAGSGHERLANTVAYSEAGVKGPAPVTVKDLRPSLIVNIEDAS